MVNRPHPKNHADVFQSRTVLLTVFLLLVFAVIAVKLFRLQIIHGYQAQAIADQQHSIYQRLLPSRGEISITDKFSPAGYPVATNIKHYLAYAVPQDIKNPAETAQSLASVLSLDPQDVLSKITETDKKYVVIKQNLTDAEQASVTALNLSGIYFDSQDARFYPESTLLSQVLGFVGYTASSTQKVGLYGLERYYENQLAGTPGYVNEQAGAGGGVIFGAKNDIVPAQDGVNLVLTIDKSIQFEAETVLSQAVQQHGADSGSVIVMNPKTGAILAMAGYPDFDPNQYNLVTNPSVFSNEATVGNYEPGSTFKAITMAAAIDENKITPQTTYTNAGSVKVNNYTIKNAEPGLYLGSQTMTQVLDFSLNTGAIYAENQLGNSDFLKYLKAFGFGQPTGITLPETAGDLSGLENGDINIDYDTASFGQGITVTPIQLIQAYSAFVNGGKMMKPYIVQSQISSDGTTVNTQPQVAGQPISAQAANTVTAMLVDVVEHGFGTPAAVPGYYIAGKTGTAQVVGTDGKYDPTNNIGSFIGFGPVENPQFLMLVRIDHPRDVEFAESTAEPAWATIAKFILSYYNIPPTRPIPAGK
jgi:cell division protein FtsI/penicillin-binding protein 2